MNGSITSFEKDFLLETLNKEMETLPYPNAILFIRRELTTCLHNIRARGRSSERWLTDTAPGVTYLANLLSSYRMAEENYEGCKVVNTDVRNLQEDFDRLLVITLCHRSEQLKSAEKTTGEEQKTKN